MPELSCKFSVNGRILAEITSPLILLGAHWRLRRVLSSVNIVDAIWLSPLHPPPFVLFSTPGCHSARPILLPKLRLVTWTVIVKLIQSKGTTLHRTTSLFVIVSRKASLGIIYYDGSVFFLPNWSVFYTLSSHRKFFIFMKCEKYNSRKIP